MKPRYVILNEVERDAFEKRWQLPYGYGDTVIFSDLEEAMLELDSLYNPTTEWVVEEISDEGRQVVYRAGLID